MTANDDAPTSREQQPPVDPVEALKEEFAGKFAGMDENLAKIEGAGAEKAEEPPIANFRSRMKDAWAGFQQAAVIYNRLMPNNSHLFGPLGAIAVTMAGEAKRQQKEMAQVARDEQLSRQREARINRDDTYAAFLNSFPSMPSALAAKGVAALSAGGVPAGLAANATNALSGAGMPAALAGQASGILGASPVFQSPAAGASGATPPNGNEGSREILTVLREIATSIKKIEESLGDDDDESEGVENRRPGFGKLTISQGEPVSRTTPATFAQVGPATRPQQNVDASTIAAGMRAIMEVVR